jgi:hypothetical protein
VCVSMAIVRVRAGPAARSASQGVEI